MIWVEALCCLSAYSVLQSKLSCALTILTAGVTVGDPVLRTGKPLSVELGPGKICSSRYQDSDQDILSPHNINKGKYQLGDCCLIQYQILHTNIIRTV